MNNKYDSLFNLIYNKANNIGNEDLDIECSVSVSFLDAYKCKRVKVLVDKQVKCECLSNEHIDSFYDECDKCFGNGTIKLNGYDVICNRCNGKGKLVISTCPLCNNKMYVLNKEEMFVTLNKENDIVIENKGLTLNGKSGNLTIHVDIYDKDAYDIKGKDVYCKKILGFKKNEFDKSKEVETCVDFTKIKLSEIKYMNIVKLASKGIDGGDFYVPVRCEVKGERGKDVYKNVILDRKRDGFYINMKDIYSSDHILNVYDYKPLNDDNYQYIKIDNCGSYHTFKVDHLGIKGKNNGENGDLYLQLFVGDYVLVDKDIYLCKSELTKNELSSGKKSIVVNGTKINVPYDRKAIENYFLDMGNYGLMLDKNQKGKLFIRINVSGGETYSISVDKKGYVSDYKKFFNENVKVCKTSNNLEDYIYVDGSEVVSDKYNNRVKVSYRKGVK